MLKASKLWMPGTQDCIFKQLIEPEPGPEGCIKILIILFHSASTLNKIPKIHVKSFKTVDTRASGVHFTTPS